MENMEAGCMLPRPSTLLGALQAIGFVANVINMGLESPKTHSTGVRRCEELAVPVGPERHCRCRT